MLSSERANGPAEPSGRRRKSIGFQPEPLEHRDEKIGQRVIAIGVKAQVLAVLETAAGQESGKVRGHMRVSISEV